MLIDVRSPSEFAHAHIPGAHNLPLFSDEERDRVGLSYKTEGKQRAFILGLTCIAPRLASFVERVCHNPSVELYCWRGGLRSQSLGWLFQQAGISTTVRAGGYKRYRREVLLQLQQRYSLRLISGLTGSGKTELLQSKEQFIDLEQLANHRGSVFGALGPQPSNEQFENLIAHALSNMIPEKTIWVEDESRMIGRCKIPDALFNQMIHAPREELFCSRAERIQRLLNDYGNVPLAQLDAGIRELEKRLGSLRMQQVLTLLHQDQRAASIDLLLTYYDQAYEKSQKKYNGRHGLSFSQ